MRRAILVISLLSSALACDTSCPELVCGAGVGIQVLDRNGWSPGYYELRIDYADVAIACEFAVPEPSAIADEDAGAVAIAIAGAGAGAVDDSSGADGGAGSCVQTSGKRVETILRVGQNVAVQLVDEPKSLRVRVVRYGTTLRDVRLTPAYKKRRENGCPACPFVVVPVVL